jgi:RNA polymerase sigma-70 factor (ECF subfamily)
MMADSKIAQVLAGDRDSYAAVIEAHQDMLMTYASFLLPDRESAEELAHRTFIRAWERLAEFDTQRDFAIWLRAICRSLAQGELTRRRRELHNLGNARAFLRHRVLAAAGDELEGLTGGDHLQALLQCLGTLDELPRDLLEARYRDGHPVAEVGRRLGRSVTWVTTTLARLRGRLRACVEQRLRLATT